jgi:flagellar biosynthesis protein FlhG
VADADKADACSPPGAFRGASIKRTGQRDKRVIAVSGGKGGAGKTVIASNLAVYLASLGRTTVIVDADRAGAHLHTLLGLPPVLPSQTVSAPEDDRFELVPAAVPGLFFVDGGVADGAAFRARPRTRAELFEAVQALDCDYMVLDLGSGLETELLDAFADADVALYVTVPEPAAVEGTYRFARALFLRELCRAATDPEAREEIESLAAELGGLPPPRELVEAMEADEHPLSYLARRLLVSFELHVVVNQTRVRADLELGESMKSAVWQRLGIDFDYIGYIDFDDTVWTCTRARKPLLVKSPSTKASKHIEKLARRLIAIETGKGARTLRTVPPGTHHDLLEVDRGATDEEIRRAYRRVRDVYDEEALCCYGLFTDAELCGVRARLEEAFDVLLDRTRRRPYELSVFPEEQAPEDDEIDTTTRTRDLPPPPTITPETEFDGALLRAVRESQGIELKQIARRTKISLSYLQAIEDDDFGALPAVVYVRGFVAEMAKVLKLDATQVSLTYVRRVKRNLGEGRV